jgi:hypothetical protein
MSGWVKSDKYPTWRKGSGIYTQTVTGACDNRKFVRQYNKIGSIFGINYVTKKDQYEEGLFGFVPLEDGADVGTWNFLGERSTNKDRFDGCFEYATRVNAVAELDESDYGKLPVGTQEVLTEDNYRPPRTSTSLPIIPMLMGVVIVIAIIFFFIK